MISRQLLIASVTHWDEEKLESLKKSLPHLIISTNLSHCKPDVDNLEDGIWEIKAKRLKIFNENRIYVDGIIKNS